MGSLSLLQGIFPTQASNAGFLLCRQILYRLSHQGSPRILEWVAYPFPGDLPDPRIEFGSLYCRWILHQLSYQGSPTGAAAAAAKSRQSCPTLRPHRRQPTRLPRPWDSPGKNTGVGCHFLLQCMKVKGESEVVQSCLTLRDPMDYSLPGSSVHGIFQARVLEWVAIVFSATVARAP